MGIFNKIPLLSNMAVLLSLLSLPPSLCVSLPLSLGDLILSYGFPYADDFSI